MYAVLSVLLASISDTMKIHVTATNQISMGASTLGCAEMLGCDWSEYLHERFTYGDSQTFPLNPK